MFLKYGRQRILVMSCVSRPKGWSELYYNLKPEPLMHNLTINLNKDFKKIIKIMITKLKKQSN